MPCHKPQVQRSADDWRIQCVLSARRIAPLAPLAHNLLRLKIGTMLIWKYGQQPRQATRMSESLLHTKCIPIYRLGNESSETMIRVLRCLEIGIQTLVRGLGHEWQASPMGSADEGARGPPPTLKMLTPSKLSSSKCGLRSPLGP